MKKALFLFVGLLTITTIQAQDILNGVYVKEHVQDRKPIPYQFVREADVMWSKIIWREIDLREKINHPLYYPDQGPIGDRMSLIDLLLHAITNEGLTAYEENGADEFGNEITMDDIKVKFDAEDKVESIEDVETGELIEKKVKGSITSSEVKSFLVKEVWFFDKQRSVMEVRIIGICPVRYSYRDEEAEELGNFQKQKLFWVYFPEARKIFANHEVYNPYNDSERKSFDDIFFKRMFSSYIYQESNAYNNRRIADYTLGMETMLEAERVKESIFNYEQDLWEY